MFDPRLPYVFILIVVAITTHSSDLPARGRTNGLVAHELTVSKPGWSMSAPKLTLPALSARAACIPPVQFTRLRGVIDRAVLRTAPNQLDLPMGGSRFVNLHGKRYLFCLEPHFREPGTGEGPSGWHKGVTVYDAS